MNTTKPLLVLALAFGMTTVAQAQDPFAEEPAQQEETYPQQQQDYPQQQQDYPQQQQAYPQQQQAYPQQQQGYAQQQQAYTYAPEPQYVTRPRMGLIIPGALMFGIPWISTMVIAASITPVQGKAMIPLIGPLFYWYGGGSEGWNWNPFLLMTSIIEIAGLTMFILGFALRRQVRVADNDALEPVEGSWALAPYAMPHAEGGGMGGLNLVGTF